MRTVTLRRWEIALAFLAVTLAFVIQGVLLTETIHDLNHDRLASCRRTYEGVREVFKPFLPPPDKRKPQQARDIRKFNVTVDRLKDHCSKQTGVHN